MDEAATKIQRAYIKKYGIKNNQNFLKKMYQLQKLPNGNKNLLLEKLFRYANGKNIYELEYNVLRKKTNVPGAKEAAIKIQRAYQKKYGIKNNQNFLKRMNEWEITDDALLENKLSRYASNRREDMWSLRELLLQIKNDENFLRVMNQWKPKNENRLEKYAYNRGYNTADNLMYNLYMKKFKDPKYKKATDIISRAFLRHIKKKNIKTDEEFIKRYQKAPYVYISRFMKKKYPGTQNISNVVNTILHKRSSDPKRLPATQKIQKVYKGYIDKRLLTFQSFITDLKNDGRFDFNVKVLTKLFERINLVLHKIKSNWGEGAHNKITTLIGPCHIKPNEVPLKYLSQMFNQMKYVTSEYQKMSGSEKKKYRDRLHEALGDRPCLENLLDGMAKVLVPPAFEWRGKRVEPLVKNNKRYLSQVIGPAISSWYNTLSNNNKRLLENKSLNTRKRLFWNMIKSQNLAIMTNNGPVYSTPNRYNVGGKRFFASNEANTLGNF